MTSAATGHSSRAFGLVLLVDRDDDTREMYAEYLAGEALGIALAADGREALATAVAHPPDLVVTETRLPGIDGYELCTRLREHPATQTVRIIIVTGDGYPADIDHARAVGADAVLIKPCLPEVLLAEIRRLESPAPARRRLRRVSRP
jgi:CheY-like chemotaxis protein